jgi:hypothetical protein
MTLSSFCLVLGGVASFLIGLLHLALALRPQWYLHPASGQGQRIVLVVLGRAQIPVGAHSL